MRFKIDQSYPGQKSRNYRSPDSLLGTFSNKNGEAVGKEQ